MTSFAHRKQILIFAASILAPSLALVFLTFRTIGQERELAVKRAREERTLKAREVGRALVARLERVERDEAGNRARCAGKPCPHVHPGTAIILGCENGIWTLPWDSERIASDPPAPAIAALLRKAEAAEFVANDPAGSARLYVSLLPALKDPVRKELVRLQLARVLQKSGRREESLAMYRQIASIPATVADEDGMPLCLYAIGALTGSGADLRVILGVLGEIADSGIWQPPVVYHRVRDLAEEIAARNTSSEVGSAAARIVERARMRTAEAEAAAALPHAYPEKGEQPADDSAPWRLANSGRWFARPSGSQDRRLLIAVRIDDLVRTTGEVIDGANDIHVVESSAADGEYLGPAFPDARLQFGARALSGRPESGTARQALYGFTLLLVVGSTAFGGYLLWRDFRREVRLASMRSQFVAGVSHELKTPLTSIRMFADTLRLGRLKDDKKREEYLGIIINESERLSRLLNNVLDFSKMEEGRMAYEFAPVSVPGVVRTAVRTMAYPLEQAGFTVSVGLAEGLPDIDGDKDALVQAVLNLLHNAMKFSGQSRQIELSSGREGSEVVIRVVDHGIGVDPPQHKRIFERFYRVASPEGDRVPGSGLGLAIVSHIVAAHGGTVGVESAPAQGSAFWIKLPFGQSRVAAESTLIANSPTDEGK